MRISDVRQWVRVGVLAGLMAGSGAWAAAQGPADALRVYFVDVEGGQATLFVAPGGENLLVDAGWPGSNNRDAGRIVAMCKRAGVTKIDNLLVTHYHVDHAGGIPQLAAKMPIGRFIDHGPNTENGDPATVRSWEGYSKLLAEGKTPHLVAHLGEVLPIKGFHAEVVSTNGEVIGKPVAGGGSGKPNPACANSPEKVPENDENDKSLGLMITFGKLRLVDLGDLTWAMERPLMCPTDNLGRVDVYIASHHGFDRSGSPALLKAIAPRVAVIDDGGHKGAEPAAWTIIKESGRIEGMWQLHTAEAPGANNVEDAHIANLKGPDSGYGLELVARRDGSVSVTNERTGEKVAYPAK